LVRGLKCFLLALVAMLHQLGLRPQSAVSAGLSVRSIGRLVCTCRSINNALENGNVWNSIIKGQTKESLRRLTKMEGMCWSSMPASTNSMPRARRIYATFAYDSTLLVCGGADARGRLMGDYWAFNVMTMQWHEAGTSEAVAPRPRCMMQYSGKILHDAGGTKWLLIHGGVDDISWNDSWILGPLGPAENAATWVWNEIQADCSLRSRLRPTPRVDQRMQAVGCMTAVLVGGVSHETNRAILDPWMLSFDKRDLGSALANNCLLTALAQVQWKKIGHRDPMPGPRSGGVSLLQWHDKMVLHGGRDDDDQLLGDTWVLDLLHGWQERKRLAPCEAAFVGIINQDTLLVAGGFAGRLAYPLDCMALLDLTNPRAEWSRTSYHQQGYGRLGLDCLALYDSRIILVFGGTFFNIDFFNEAQYKEDVYDSFSGPIVSRRLSRKGVNAGISDTCLIQLAENGTLRIRNCFTQIGQHIPRRFRGQTKISVLEQCGMAVVCYASGTHLAVARLHLLEESAMSSIVRGDGVCDPSSCDRIVTRVTQDILHNDPPAIIAPDEAQVLVRSIWETYITDTRAATEEIHSWASVSSSSCCDAYPSPGEDCQPGDYGDKILVLNLSRVIPECFEALGTSRALEQVRWQMGINSCKWQIEPSGAHVFVYSAQYEQVLSWCKGFDLRAHHVIISEAFQPLLKEALRAIPSKRHVRTRSAHPALIVGHNAGDDAVVVQLTFYAVRNLNATGCSVPATV